MENGAKKYKDTPQPNMRFRVVGTVWQKSPANKPDFLLGYVVFDYRTGETTVMFELDFAKFCFENKGYIVNVTVTPRGVVEFTECPVGSLTKYFRDGEPFDNVGITILARIVRKVREEQKTIGYKVRLFDGRVLNMDVEHTIRLAKSRSDRVKTDCKPITNGKIVVKNGTEFISALTGTFPVIVREFAGATRVLKKPIQSSNTPTEGHQGYSSDTVGDVVSEPSTPKNSDEDYHKVKFRDKAVSFFFDQFLRKGTINPIDSAYTRRYAKIATKEYFTDKYPTVVRFRGVPPHIIMEAMVVAHLVTDGVYRRSDGTPITVPNIRARILFTASDKPTGGVPVMPQHLMDWVEAVSGSKDGYTFFETRNKFVTGMDSESVLPHLETKVLNDLLIAWSVKRSSYPRIRKSHKKQNYNPAHILFEFEKGFNEMGYALDGGVNKVGDVYNSVVYGEKPLKPMYAHIDMPSSVLSQVTPLVKNFGDVELLRKILKVTKELSNGIARNYGWGNRQGKLKQEQQVYLASLSAFNPDLAYIVNAFVGDVAEFNILDMKDKFSESDPEDRLFYISGGNYFKDGVIRAKKSLFGNRVQYIERKHEQIFSNNQ